MLIMAIGTNRKQSKALLKLGIPKQTADMHISWHWDSAVESKKVWELNTGFPWRNDHIPAWSVEALANLFPFPKAVDEPIFKLIKGCVSFEDMTVSWPNKWIARFWGCKGIGKTQVDAVVNLIVTLYDNGIRLW